MCKIYLCFLLSISVQPSNGSRLRRQNQPKITHPALDKIQSVLPEDLVIEAKPSSSEEKNIHAVVSSRTHRLLGVPIAAIGSNAFIQFSQPWQDGKLSSFNWWDMKSQFGAFRSQTVDQHKKKRKRKKKKKEEEEEFEIPEGGYPMNCSTPICDRHVHCKGATCCNTVMFNALSSITDWMDRNQIEYVVLDGTLLGGARNQDVIPWTADLDIGIHSKDVPKVLAQRDIPFHFAYTHQVVIPRGCEAHNPGFPGEYNESTPTLQSLAYGDEPQKGQGSYYIDIYPFETWKDFSKDFDSGCLQKMSNGTIRKGTVQIRDRKFKAPVKIKTCLEEWYGDDWMTPQPDNHNDVVDLDTP